MVVDYDPKILAFCCQWCSYSGADLAGAMRMQYPPNIRIILVPCTGRVDILHVLQAFEAGADAVFIAGCHDGDCHYITGNFLAKKRVSRIKQILAAAGLEPERVEMFQVAASEGAKFAQVATEMTARALRLGPNPVRLRACRDRDRSLLEDTTVAEVRA
jgi:F420-non-reducing hydrogenase iron-sulfur subunit